MRVSETSQILRVGAVLLLALATQALAAEPARAPEWPWWRGPLGNGVSPDGDPPVRWSEKDNVRFKVAIEGDGLATPVVNGDRIYVLSAKPIEGAAKNAKQRFLVTAFDRRDGSVKWQRVAVERVPHEGHHQES